MERRHYAVHQKYFSRGGTIAVEWNEVNISSDIVKISSDIIETRIVWIDTEQIYPTIYRGVQINPMNAEKISNSAIAAKPCSKVPKLSVAKPRSGEKPQ